MVQSITKRKLSIGIFCSVFVLALGVIVSLYNSSKIDLGEFAILKGLIYNISSFFCHITIWILIKRVIVVYFEQKQLKGQQFRKLIFKNQKYLLLDKRQ